ncbi:MAG: hypothetical protein OQJ95_09900 [Kangiella sp.]|nr:hypothetical protein [Kangiella sp.]
MNKNTVILLGLLFSWLVIILNFLVFNRYAYYPTLPIRVAGFISAVLVCVFLLNYVYKDFKKTKDYRSLILLLLFPVGMAFVTYYTLYAIGGTVSQITGVFNEKEYEYVTIDNKNIKDYVSAGGCQYTIDLVLDSGERINNHCVPWSTFNVLEYKTPYKVAVSKSMFGLIIFDIGKYKIKTVPNLRRF